MKRKLRNMAVVLLLILPCAELAARLIGWRPYENIDYSVQATPESWIIGDSILGLRLNPGVYSLTLDSTIHFLVTHSESGTRKVVAPHDNSKKVAVFGCSFTYGYGVNDDKVFTNVLQKMHPEVCFTNYAVPGYGTIQSLLQLEKLDKDAPPDYAILVYSAVHPERNALANSYRRALKIGFSNSNNAVDAIMKNAKIPFRGITSKKTLYSPWNELYSHWMGRDRFAIVHALQSTMEKEIEVNDQIRITSELLIEFILLCENSSIVPIIVNLDDREFMDKYVLKADKIVIDIDFDFTNPEITNLPYDSHPNSIGHEKIANKISKEIQELLNE